jgi:uncharacterized protein YycO
VEHAGTERYLPGEQIQNPRPADFILTHEDAWTSRLIQLGQSLRFRGEDARYAFWNHTAIFTDEQGSIVEALGAGVRTGNISSYQPTEYTVVRIDASDEDRQEAVAFARDCVGKPYGWFTIVSIGFSLLTGAKFAFAFEGQHICSGLVARALERTTAIFNRDPTHIMPADLAKYYEVVAEPGTPKGAPPKRK